MRWLAAAILVGGTIAGCAAPSPLVLDSDAKGIDIEYPGDPAATMPIARLHCAQYERAARLLQAQNNVAYYECIRVGAAAGP
jgi:hypothetical protein